MIPIDLFLTKEAFKQYSIRLREEKAREHGMTLEQWDAAVASQQIVHSSTGSWNGPSTPQSDIKTDY
jgi:hypothetical protein